jgi:hypothetical protein
MEEETKEVLRIIDHKERVANYIVHIAHELLNRSVNHDSTKLQKENIGPSLEGTKLLHGVEYGSEQYKETLKKIKPNIDNHYAHNSHHPEHYPNGINDMSIIDIIEMLCDWKAATARHPNGNMPESFEINQKRFNISPQLIKIFKNTLKYIE